MDMAGENHILTAAYSAGGHSATRAAYQYDYGQVLVLEGFPEGMLPDVFEMHFGTGGGRSVTVLGHGGQADIPDECLTTRHTVTAWLYLHDTEADGETRYEIEIPVRPRAAISGQAPTPVQRDIIEDAIAALNTAVRETAEYEESAAGSAYDAYGYALRAETAQTYAEDAQGAAEDAQAAAEAAQGAAETAQGAAEAAQTAAEAAQGAAETAQTGAEGSASEAADSALEAAGSASDAATSERNAAASAAFASISAEQADDNREDAEAYAVGTRDGTAVGSTDPAYQNNSKYYAENAGEVVVVSATQPTHAYNRLWIEEGAELEYIVPTHAEMNAADGLRVPKPATNPDGASGQLLRTNGDGTTTWVDEGLPTDAQTAEAVGAWLDEHPDATTTVQDGAISRAKLDSTVGAAVDDVAKIRGMLGTVTGNPEITGWSENKKYIKLNDSTADVFTPQTTTSNVHYVVLQATEGDQFTVTASGGSGSRAYGFVAANGTVLERASANASVQNLVVTAPEDTAYFVINDTTLTGVSYYGVIADTRIRALSKTDTDLSAILAMAESIPLEYIFHSGAHVINSETGELGGSSIQCKATKYIDVSMYAALSYKRCKWTTSSSASGMAFYNNNKVFISGIGGLTSQSERGYADAVCNVPEGAKYARFTTQGDNYPAFTVSGVPKLVSMFSGTSDRIGAVEDDVDDINDIIIIKNVFTDWTVASQQKYVSPQSIGDGDSYVRVNKSRTGSDGNQYAVMACEAGDHFIVTGPGGTYVRAYIFADDDGYTYQDDTDWCGAKNTSYTNHEITAPAGATRLYVNRNNSTASATDYKYQTIKEYAENVAKPVNKGVVVVSLGDSIFGNFRSASGPKESISHMVAEQTGMICYNHAFGGTHAHSIGATSVMDFEGLATAIATGDFTAQIAYAGTKRDPDAYTARVTDLAETDFSKVDIVTVSYGTNDWSSNTTPARYYEALITGITTIAEAYPNLRFLLCTPIIRFKRLDDPIYDAETEESTGTSDIIIDSDDDRMKNKGLKKLSEYAEKVQEAGLALHVPVCENYWTLGLNLYNQTNYMGGMAERDLVHPNAKGRRLIAHHLIDALNRM